MGRREGRGKRREGRGEEGVPECPNPELASLRHLDAVNNGRQDIDQIYTAALTLKFAKVAVFNVWLPVGHCMR